MKLVTALSNKSRICAGLLLSIATAALAQQNETPALEPAAPPPLPLIEMPANPPRHRMPDPSQGLIRVDVTVTDRDGKPVVGLTQRDFTLLDNDQQNQIVTFQAFNGGIQPADSFEVALVIDELNTLTNIRSGKTVVSATDRVAEAFLRSHAGVLQHPTIIYRLTGHGLFATPTASIDGNDLAHAIEHGKQGRRIWSPSTIADDVANISAGGGVSARISQSLIALGSIAIEERRKPGRKLVFWIGNGWQIENRRASGIADFSAELLTRMREARISLWGSSEWPLYDSAGNPAPVNDDTMKEYLGGPRPDSTSFEYLSLPVIAARSGGGMLDAGHDLGAMIDERVKDESRYYSITFDPPRTNVIDEYHHLHIEIDKADLKAGSCEDYYDEPVFYDQPPVKKPVTVKELEMLIANSHDSSGSLADQLRGMQLTERLSSAKLDRLEKDLRAANARTALRVVADESVFLPPPADEILSTPPPDACMQRQIIAATVSYIKSTIPKLPDFFATRTTVQYHEPLPRPGQTWKTATGDQSLYEGETATGTLRFHDGKEHAKEQSVTSDASLHQGRMQIAKLEDFLAGAEQRSGLEHLQTIGTFGPILVTVMAAATLPHSELKWARWEQGEYGQLAVFRYRVPQETPLFSAEFCCLADDFEAIQFRKSAPFHGEIAVNPSSGAIMRLTVQADLEWRLPLEISNVMVEYRPEQKSGRTFICPSKSVSISRQRRNMLIKEWGESFRVYAPFETLLNEMRFDKYRIFGSTSRILPDFDVVPKEK